MSSTRVTRTMSASSGPLDTEPASCESPCPRRGTDCVGSWPGSRRQTMSVCSGPVDEEHRVRAPALERPSRQASGGQSSSGSAGPAAGGRDPDVRRSPRSMNPWNRGGATPMTDRAARRSPTTAPSTSSSHRIGLATRRSLMTATASSEGFGRPADDRRHAKVAEEILRYPLDLAGWFRARRRRERPVDPGAKKPTISDTTWLCVRTVVEGRASEKGDNGFLNPARQSPT